MLVAGVLAAMTTHAQAAAAPWPEESFTYHASNERMSKVLASFARTFGLEVRTSPAIRADDVAVEGRFSMSSPTAFLNLLCAMYGMVWYYDAGTLHVSRISETVKRGVSTGGIAAANLKKALTDLGVIDPRFGWGEIAERSMVLVEGPPAYVAVIERTVAELPPPPPPQQVRVFRLQHASVDDRTIQYRDRQITTSGVANILRSLISGEGKAGTTTQMIEMAAPLRAAIPPLSTTESDPPPPASPPKDKPSAGGTRSSAGSIGGGAVIQADSRLNAIIVRDKPENMPIYEQLIALLDTPSSLIEIEAMIVDVNRTKVSKLGVDWGARAGRFAGGFGQPATPPGATTMTLVNGAGVNPTTVIPSAGAFLMARVDAMEGDGDARIVSRPSVLTTDNLGALIDLSETFYVQSTGERVANVTPITVGVTLRVTPHIIEQNGARAVQLIVDIEDGAIQDLQIQNLPTVRRSTIGTQAVVAENGSLVIGGFNSETDVRQKDGVPLLGKLPGIGALFSKTSTDVEKRERLFMITPRIVQSAAVR
jgi:type III secretion protein C